jgi:SAM-dependent methyltransferase
VGKQWTGRKVEITATDPLAEKYAALIQRLKVPAIVPVQKVEAEKLTEHFPQDHFDLAYASNCLDHSYDPIQAIRQMLLVVKPGHYVYLWHFANAGIEECYQGLHQWNFEVEGDQFTVSDGRKTRRLAEELGVLAERVKVSQTRAFNTRVVIAEVQKRVRK